MKFDFHPDKLAAYVRIKGATPEAGPAGEFFSIAWMDAGVFVQLEKVKSLVISATYFDSFPENVKAVPITPFDTDGNQLVSIQFTPQMSLHTDEDLEQIWLLISADDKMGDPS